MCVYKISYTYVNNWVIFDTYNYTFCISLETLVQLSVVNIIN